MTGRCSSDDAYRYKNAIFSNPCSASRKIIHLGMRQLYNLRDYLFFPYFQREKNNKNAIGGPADQFLHIKDDTHYQQMHPQCTSEVRQPPRLSYFVDSLLRTWAMSMSLDSEEFQHCRWADYTFRFVGISRILARCAINMVIFRA